MSHDRTAAVGPPKETCRREERNGMGIPVKLPVFEGPLDLLLHLIDKNKIDIYDIPIVEITEQYLEYKMYKYMSYELRDRMNEASRSVYKKPTLPEEVLEYREPVDTSELLSNVTLERLNAVYRAILRRQENKIDPIRSKFGKIEKEEISLPDKMTYVERYAVARRNFSFRALLEAQPGKNQIIVTFLAILELMKTGKIRIVQEEAFGEIRVESLEAEGTVVVPYTEAGEEDSEDELE